MDWRSPFFSFKGRINRAKYWLAILISCIVDVILDLTKLASGQGIMGLSFVVGLVYLVGSLAVIVASLAIGIKRLRDRDKSAWWLLFFYLAPGALVLVGLVVGIPASMASGMTADTLALLFRICIIVALAIGVWAFVEFGCLRGTVGYNRYGPDPLEPRRLPAHT